MEENKKTKEETIKILTAGLEETYISICYELAKSIWKAAPSVFGENGEYIQLALYLEKTDKESIAASMEDFSPRLYLREGEYGCKGNLTADEKDILNLLAEVYNGQKKISTVGFSEKEGVTSGQKKLVDNNLYGQFRAIWVVYLLGDCEGESESKVCKIMLNTLAEYIRDKFDDINEIISDCIRADKGNKEETSHRESTIKRDAFAQMYCKQVFSMYSQLPRVEECDKLGLQDYEGREPIGTVVFLKDEYNSDGVFIDLNENNCFYNHKLTRKMLECVQRDQCLLVCGEEYNVVGITKIENIEKMPHIRLEYHGLADWCVKCGDEVVLHYKRGSYYVSEEDYREETRKKLEKYFGESSNIVEIVVGFIEEMLKCEHGALMIVTEDEGVGEYLKSARSGIKLLKTMKFNEIKDYITGLATIDGAVILNYKEEDDSECVCEAFGAILDREPMIKGDPARGARYNSARKYIYNKNAIAVIISEDKTNGVEIYHGILDDFEPL